jgi:hypothetical protein
MKHKSLTIFLSAFVLFSACKKDSDHAKPITLYCIKSKSSPTTAYQLVAIDPATGNESVVITLSGFDTQYGFKDIEYLPATNEIVGLSNTDVLVKMDLAKTELSTVKLPSSFTTDIPELFVDNTGTLYGLKVDWPDQKAMYSLVKIDPQTGNTTMIKTFDVNWRELVYIPASNTVVGVAGQGRQLLKFNLTSNDTSWVQLPASNLDYQQLVVVDGKDLYGYKDYFFGSSPTTGELTKIDLTTGQETSVAQLNNNIHSELIYLPQRKEIAAVWNYSNLFQFNITTKDSTIKRISPDLAIYGPITSN